MKRQKSLAVNKAIRGNVFPVVGIGASAGGLNAFSAFLKAVHPTSNAAFVFVQHLDPKKKSLLPSLLSRVTDIPLTEVTTTTKIQA
ncbi:MAG: chemotaxis protein CheB, partial [Patescibacteria group bacterium]